MDVNSTVPPVSTQDSPLPNSIPAEATPAAPTVRQTMASAAPPAGPAPSAAPPPVVAKKQAHNNILATAVRTLMGHRVGYRFNDKGQEEEYDIQEKPGQLFRHILAGAVLGGAMGGKEKSFGGGVARGYEAEADKEEQMRQERRQAAGEDYKRQLETKKENREQSAFESEQKVREANLAHLNIQTIRENDLHQNDSYTAHVGMAERGDAWAQGYVDAGVSPAIPPTPESEMAELRKANPSYNKYIWVATGQPILSHDGKGNATWESYYQAFDPDKKYVVPAGLAKQLKDSKLSDHYGPELADLLKPGKELNQDQLVALYHKAKTYENDSYDRQSKNSKLTQEAAVTRHENLESAKIEQEIADSKEEAQGWADLKKAGGDVGKMPEKSREAFSKALNSAIKNSADVLRSEMQGREPGEPLSEAAQNVQKSIEAKMKVQDQLLGIGTTTNPIGGNTVQPATSVGTPAGSVSTGIGRVVNKIASPVIKTAGNILGQIFAPLTDIPGVGHKKSDEIIDNLNSKKTVEERKSYIDSLDIPEASKEEIRKRALQPAATTSPTPAGTKYASNPQTNQWLMSTDGGKTWQPSK